MGNKRYPFEDLKSGNFVSMEESLDVVNKETSQGYLEIE